MAISKDESCFIANTISNNIRIDLRRLDERRQQVIEILNHEFYEGSAKVQRMNSEIEVFVNFQESSELLFDLGLIPIGQISSSNYAINLPGCFDLKKYFDGFFKKFRLNLQIIVKIIHDDGGTNSLVCDALALIFDRFEAPLFNSFNSFETVEYKIEIPKCSIFAVYGDQLILDPSKIEEEAAEGIFEILSFDNEIQGAKFNSQADYSMDTVLRHLQSIKTILF